MKFKFGIKEVVATGIGTALFVALTQVQIPMGFIPNTSLQPRAALLAFLAAVFGPVVGGIVGLLGHALGDALFYGSVWWSWVFPDAVFGLLIGHAEPVSKAFAQGFWAFLGNIIVVGILGSLLAAGYSRIGAKSSSLSKED